MALHQQPVGLLREHNGCQQIERYDLLGELGTSIGGCHRRPATRVVNQDIQPAKPFFNGIDNGLRCGRVANVCTKESGDFLIVGNGHSGLTTTQSNHLCALAKQCLTDRTTNMAGSTGHQTDLSFQLRHSCIH